MHKLQKEKGDINSLMSLSCGSAAERKGRQRQGSSHAFPRTQAAIVEHKQKKETLMRNKSPERSRDLPSEPSGSPNRRSKSKPAGLVA